jgi:hypothetical protein
MGVEGASLFDAAQAGLLRHCAGLIPRSGLSPEFAPACAFDSE